MTQYIIVHNFIANYPASCENCSFCRRTFF